ncbi:MAG: hypothetical protein JRI38_02525 [Deltaproteobacteria bacterium]|nr:hypothetical protein [Deltaproteobacteria bacterium]
MEKKYIIIVFIVLTAWISLMGYRHFLTTKETREHYQEAYNRMEIIALKTPSGGLAQMAMALNKYHQENKHYPDSLMDLHPEYVISKSFLTRINWQYKSQVDNFSLSKTVTINNREISASIDKSLRPSTGSKIMLATAVPVKKAPVIAPLPAPLEPDNKSLVVETISFKQQQAPEVLPEIEVETYIETGSASPMASALSNKYLVWKDKNGNLGFGNINYPDKKNISICTADKWLTLAKTRLPAVGRKQGSEIMTALQQNQNSAIGRNRRFLVWKNKQGILGFGNVDYPSREQVSLIYANGDWQKINGGSNVRP